MKILGTLRPLLAGLAVSAGWPAFSQTILLNDTFSDGQRDNQNLPASAAWYLLNDNTVMPTASVNPDRELAWADKPGTYSGLIAFFSPGGQPQSLGIGDSLKLEFRMALDNLSAAQRVIRIGLMNSGGKRISADALNSGATGLAVGTTFTDWRGYALLTAAGDSPAANLFSIVERTAANSALWSSGAFTQVGAATASPSLVELEFQPVELTITRRAAEVEISGRLGEVTIGPVIDTAALVTTFDTIALFVQPQINGLRLDDIKVTFVPSAAPSDDPNLVVITETVFGRLPLDAPSPSGRVSIKNGGASRPLTLQPQSTITGPDAAHYRIVTPLPLSIGPGATGVVEVAFNPQSRFGDFAATLELRSNDPSESVLPVTLDARYFHSGDQLLTNPGFELAGTVTDWAQAGTIADAAGLITGSTKAVFLNSGARLGRNGLVAPGDFQLDFRLAVPESADQAFELLLKTFPGFDRGNPFFDLRYNAGQFNVLSNGVWSGDLGLGSVEASVDANLDGDLDDPGDARNVYRLQLTAHGWGGDKPTYDLGLSEKNSEALTRQVTGLAGFVGGGGGGAAPPVILLFSAENNPGYWLDEVRLIAGLPKAPTFNITQVTRDPNLGRITIVWQSEAGAKYNLESTAALGSPWNVLAADLPGVGGTTSFTDMTVASSVRFYRVLRR